MGKSYKATAYSTNTPITSNKTYTTTTTTGKPIEFNVEDWHKEWTLNSPITIEEPKGWVCPKCGRVNAPWVGACPCSQTQTKTIKTTWTTGVPSYCMGCSNHPINGGSGICHCILGTPKITCSNFTF